MKPKTSHTEALKYLRIAQKKVHKKTLLTLFVDAKHFELIYFQ